MKSILGMAILLSYVLVLLLIGSYGARMTGKTREEYFMAGRGLGSIAVFMTLFATNITAFTIIGQAGFAYHVGFGAYGYVIGWSIFVTPFTYYLIGYRSWLLGKRFGYATQPQVFGGILNSRAVSLLFLFLLLYYTLPYLVVSIIGGGLAFSTISDGLIPYWLAAALIVGVSLLYTVPAGMRGTAWTDIFQGALFLVISVLLLAALVKPLGGFAAITERVARERPDLLQRALSPELAPANWFSFSFINSIAVIVFPQIFTRIMASRNSRSLKQVTLFYPAAMALIFGISTLLGVWGAVSIPGLLGKESDNIVPLLISRHLSPLWTVLGLLMILAIVKSSIDSQLLTVAHLVTDDLIAPYKQIPPGQAVLWGRIVLICFSAAAFFIALLRPAAILTIAAFAFSGFSIMLPVMIGVLYWPRANKYGTCAALILPAIVLHLWYLELLPPWSTFGLMPVVPAFFLSAFTLIAVSLLTPPPPAALQKKTFGFFSRIFER